MKSANKIINLNFFPGVFKSKLLTNLVFSYQPQPILGFQHRQYQYWCILTIGEDMVKIKLTFFFTLFNFSCSKTLKGNSLSTQNPELKQVEHLINSLCCKIPLANVVRNHCSLRHLGFYFAKRLEELEKTKEAKKQSLINSILLVVHPSWHS